MVDFSSPVFYQIYYLITTIKRSNYKANVVELTQLLHFYGEDAHIFYLSCLLNEIDTNDIKSAHTNNTLKLQLLTQEFIEICNQPNYVTCILQAIGGVSMTPTSKTTGNPWNNTAANIIRKNLSEDGFITQILKQLKLELYYEICIGIALCYSQVHAYVTDGAKLLRSKTMEIVNLNPNEKLPLSLIHSLVILLKSRNEFQLNIIEMESLLELLESIYPSVFQNLDFLPLKSTTTPQSLLKVDTEMAESMATIGQTILTDCCNFYEFMEDLGYNCTSNVTILRAVINESRVDNASPVKNKKKAIAVEEIAGLVLMLMRTRANLEGTDIAMLFGQLTNDAFTGEVSNLNAWNISVIKQVLVEDYHAIQWEKVVDAMDQFEFDVSERDLQYLMQIYQELSGAEFPLASLVKTRWNHSQTQAKILKLAAEYELLNFIKTKNKAVLFDGCNTNENYEGWLNIDFINMLFNLYPDNKKMIMEVFMLGRKKHPEVLLCSLAKAKNSMNALRLEIVSDILSYIIYEHPKAPVILSFLWYQDPSLVLESSVICFLKAKKEIQESGNNTQLSIPKIFPRLFALYANVQDALITALQSSYFTFAIFLAVSSANQDAINLETWLGERLTTYRQAFVVSCLSYIRSWCASSVPKARLTTVSSINTLTYESLGIMLKCISSTTCYLSYEVLQEFKSLVTLIMSLHPLALQQPGYDKYTSITTEEGADRTAIQPNPTSEDFFGHNTNTSTVMSEQIEEQANAYFQRIYTSEQRIEEVIEMLTRFKNSSNEVERSIFMCMMHNLFDEYRFFPKYPDNELRITGVLFGNLIEHQLVTHVSLTVALRYVLEALKKPPPHKLFFFGIYALQQFLSRLPEMPQYCAHLSQITHLYQAAPELMKKVESIVKENPSLQATASPALSSIADKINMEREDLNFTTAAETENKPSLSADGLTILQNTNANRNVTAESTASPALNSSSPNLTATGLDTTNIFGPPIEEEEIEVQPDEAMRDRMHFIINNVSAATLDQKCQEASEILVEKYFKWFADYLITKRISTQANFHALYLSFIEKLNEPLLEAAMHRNTLQHTRKLLETSTITSNSQERTLLKNLGLWIGLFTLSRNKPLLQRDIDVKELLYAGYETGHLIAVVPFVSKILDGCKKSKIFKPPNPWIMGLMATMREIYDLPDLKLNIKFEIEVLCKTMKLKVEEIKKSHTLFIRSTPQRISNPDFNVKNNNAATGGFSKPHLTPPQGTNKEDRLGEKQARSAGAMGANAIQETLQDVNTVIPNLSSYVTVNPSILLFQSNPNLKNAVSIAVDRAIREIIQPVVERSVTIACITTKELILKDFVCEKNESKLRKASHLMVANLAGSLALVTSKEPLRIAIGNHLRNIITTISSGIDSAEIEQAVQLCSVENLELSCMLIEKASTEKAIRDIDESLSSAYNIRRRMQPTATGEKETAFMDPLISSQIYPNLPDLFKPHAVSAQQFAVYEAFHRSARQITNAGATLRTAADETPISKTDEIVNALSLFTSIFEKADKCLQTTIRQSLTNPSEGIPTMESFSNDSEIVHLLREMRVVASQIPLAIRDDVCIGFAQRILKCLYGLDNSRVVASSEELYIEVYVNVIYGLAEHCRNLRKEVGNWLLHMPLSNDKLKLHCDIILQMLKLRLIVLSEFDVYLTNHVEHNLTTGLELIIYLLRHCLTMEHVSLSTELPRTLECLERILQRPNVSNNTELGTIISKILEKIQKTTPVQPTVMSPGRIGPARTPNGSSQTFPTSALRNTISSVIEQWIAICKDSPTEKIYAQYLTMLKRLGFLKDEETLTYFLKYSVQLVVEAVLKSAYGANYENYKDKKVPLNHVLIDSLTKLMVLLVRYIDPNPTVKLQVLNRAYTAITSVLIQSYDNANNANAATANTADGITCPIFDQRIFFRLYANLSKDLLVPDLQLISLQYQILSIIGTAYNGLQPLLFPGFAFSWLELISHRSFMPNLLLNKQSKGGHLIFHQLLVSLFIFTEPYLRTMVLTPAIRLIYKGTLRIMLVLLHDFPDFLCEHYTAYCDLLPMSCIQLRNLILSAFPRNMRLPDPLASNLQIALLPEISKSPEHFDGYLSALMHSNALQENLNQYLTSGQSPVGFLEHLSEKFMLPEKRITAAAPKYSIPLLNAFVLYVGIYGTTQLFEKKSVRLGDESKDVSDTTDEIIEYSSPLRIFRHLLATFDSEGRYLLFSSMANHLRYPNSQTYYFSRVLLRLFSTTTDVYIKEQIVRVLLERLISNRPHPWGLLVTFIELIRNTRYRFWEQKYLECSQDIKMVFDDVARGCMAPALNAAAVADSASVGKR